MNIMMLIMGMFACTEKNTDTATEPSSEASTEPSSEASTEPSGEPSDDPLAFIGSWEDNYGTLLDVTESDIMDSYGNAFAIDSYSNEERYVIAQNDANNAYNPDLWSKFEWTSVDDDLYYCQIAYDAADAETAMDATADPNDTAAGCNGFGWSMLRNQIVLMGSYTDNWGGSHTINAFSWTSGESIFHIDDFSNEEGWIVAQNDANNEYNPELWSKFEWTNVDDMLYYCQIAYDAADAETAMDAAADPNDTEGGCNGFGWSSLTLSE